MEVAIVRTKSGSVIVCLAVACRESHQLSLGTELQTDRVWPVLSALPMSASGTTTILPKTLAEFSLSQLVSALEAKLEICFQDDL